MRSHFTLRLAAVTLLSAVLLTARPVLAQTSPADAPSGPVVNPVSPILPVNPGTSNPPAAPTVATVAVGVPLDYPLDTDDTISIGITRHSDVGGIYRIPPDGLLRLQRTTTPIEARGKTCAELISEITGRLVTEGKLVLRPGQVSVVVVGVRTRRVYVRGSAVRGSDFDLKNGWRVADLVAVLGSVPQPDRVHARLTNPARTGPITIDLNTALNHPEGPANVVLQEGDTLTIDSPAQKRLLITGEGPRGEKQFEDWMGLKRALLSIGVTAFGGSGDLTEARIIRHSNPEDINSAATYIPVNLQTLLTDDKAADIPFQDLDTLDIPLSQKFVMVVGEVGGMRKWYMPQDRKTYLTDVFTSTGDVGGRAAIGRIRVFHEDPKDGKVSAKDYDLGRYMSKADMSQNPEIKPGDMIYVPTNNKTDYIGNLWTGLGLYGVLKSFVPGLR